MDTGTVTDQIKRRKSGGGSGGKAKIPTSISQRTQKKQRKPGNPKQASLEAFLRDLCR
jgi:hypothetical protein